MTKEKIKFTWIRYVILFMIKNPMFRAKWFLRIFRNHKTHIIYDEYGNIKDYLKVSDIARFM